MRLMFDGGTQADAAASPDSRWFLVAWCVVLTSRTVVGTLNSSAVQACRSRRRRYLEGPCQIGLRSAICLASTVCYSFESIV
ncbi:hypothetical protein BDW69DRAFT_160570 [Aspergillus filifer]